MASRIKYNLRFVACLLRYNSRKRGVYRKSLRNQLVKCDRYIAELLCIDRFTGRSSCLCTIWTPETPHHDVCLVGDGGKDLCNKKVSTLPCYQPIHASLNLSIHLTCWKLINTLCVCAMKLKKSLHIEINTLIQMNNLSTVTIWCKFEVLLWLVSTPRHISYHPWWKRPPQLCSLNSVVLIRRNL